MGRRRSSLVLLALHTVLLEGVRGYNAELKLESARLYGDVSDEYAYYFVDLLIGSPLPQRASVIVDTGSTICAFPCSGCSHCGSHLDATFDVSRSATAQWVSCAAGHHCSSCYAGRCSYLQAYTEGSSISGSYVQDYISLGDEFQHNPPVPAQFGCHDKETKLFYTQRANGIFGLAAGNTGKPSILQDLFRDKAHINSDVFSMCLSPDGGLITFGGYNKSLHKAGHEIVWVPMQTRGSYGISVASLHVDPTNEMVASMGFGAVIVDSGTTFAYFPSVIYKALVYSVESYCRANQDCGGSPSQNCWSLPVGETPTKFPDLRFTLSGGVRVLWRGESYMYRKSANSLQWCMGFQDNMEARETVLGATWMIGFEVIFDLSERRLGVVQANCPNHHKRPSPPAAVRPEVLPPLIGAWAKPAKGASSSHSGQSIRLGERPVPSFMHSMLAAALGFAALAGCFSMVRNFRTAEHRFERLTETSAAKSPLELGTLSPFPGSRRKPTSLSASPQKKLEGGQGEGSGNERSPAGAVPLQFWLSTCAPDSASPTGSDSPMGQRGAHLSSGSDHDKPAGNLLEM